MACIYMGWCSWLLLFLCKIVLVLFLLSLPLFAKFLSLTVCDWLASSIVSWHALFVKLAKLVSLVSEHVLWGYGSCLFTSPLQTRVHKNNCDLLWEKGSLNFHFLIMAKMWRVLLFQFFSLLENSDFLVHFDILLSSYYLYHVKCRYECSFTRMHTAQYLKMLIFQKKMTSCTSVLKK